MIRSKKFQLFIFSVIVFVISLSAGIRKNNHWGYFLMLSWDSQGYYLYLPAVLINHGFENLDVRADKNNPDTYTFSPYPGTDKVFTKYTYGVALMESPFFIISRALYKLRHSDEPGVYSSTYMISIIYADSFYLAAGLFFLGLFLLRYFHLWVIILTELIIWLGTNLLFYTSFTIGFSHVCSFFLIASLICLTPVLYERRKTIHILFAAVIFGLISVIRPTNIVIILYPLLYDVYSWQQLKNRVQLLLQNLKLFICFGIFAFIAWLPQLAYWHYLSGNWLIYSYQGEGFTRWKDPKIFSVLFHPQNGFFLFAPLMLLSMVGLVVCIRRKIFSGGPILLIFLITDYICGSWHYWNFGASYGFRPYIDFLPLLAIPLAYFLDAAGRWHMPYRIVLGASIIFLLFISIRLQIIYVYPWQGPDWGWQDIVRIHKEALFIK
jgi:hypothetical protein